jgi:hypothetical protein
VSVSECAAALVAMVRVLDITLTRVLHEEGGTVMGCWREEQVCMIRHQAPGMYTAVIFGGLLCQVRSGRRGARPVTP